MPRISQVTLDQINRQIDLLDTLHAQVQDLQKQLNFSAQHVAVTDPIHAPTTSNNMIFTWTGGSQQLSWVQGFLKDKNWTAQTTADPAVKSSAKGQQHMFPIPAGAVPVNPSTFYWLGWDPVHQKMLATTDVSALHGNYNVHVICQVFTGTAGQTGVAGGGGSNGGVDLSGTRYKNF